MTAEDDAKLARLRETLQSNVDLTTYETEVYLALVRGGTQTMTDIAEASDVPKQRVYDIVGNLRERGLVEVIDDYPQKAYAVDPSESFSSIRDQLSQAETYLEELHDTVEKVESGVALFKSESTIKRYVGDLMKTAERDIFLLVPISKLGVVVDDLANCTEQQIRLVVSNVSPESDDLSEALSIPDTVDKVRFVSTREDFALTADRRRGLYWVQEGYEHVDDDGQGYYVTNPSLALVLDRFLSESIWPLATPLSDETELPTLPKEYIRIRDCLADLSLLTTAYPVDAFEVQFEGYDTETGDKVTKRGTLTSYYYTEYDIRASLTVNVGTDAESIDSSVVTVGDAGARNVDYAASRIKLRQNGTTHMSEIDSETQRHLEACRTELPDTPSDVSAVICFDAFIDRMREFIHRTEGGDYKQIRKFDAFREELVRYEASDAPPRIEWRETRTEPGGLVAHIGGVFDELGYDVTLMGRLGDPIRSEFVHTFQDQTLVTLGQVTSTDYVWFEDRKFLLTEPNFDHINWQVIEDRVGANEFAGYVDGNAVLSIGSWYSTAELVDIVDAFRTELWPRLSSPPKHVHFVPGEVTHLSSAEIERGCESLTALDDIARVTITASRSQTRRFRDVLLDDSNDTEPTVERLRQRFGVSRYVMQSQNGAIVATPDEVISARAPQVVDPHRLRNAEEHFLSGMTLALAEDLSPGASLVLANSVASFFMRHNRDPKSAELRSFIAEYDTYFSNT
ncbi:Sugar-specific transcriptional regulator TrmB [Halogranum amylolyticum]|uniref:Sugar-specific transcriptional regulator TrmB n=1 Tax=Halogranum amylolyticum TaxID=660520 RepID=A0A1H8VMU8_9EURY|nr:TrmB family transcriptional regulator sugar-binding domain-containing protein [Halogranum amylolyticum]SEP16634.1 Sugar-specific transcriptional regulator TrmB [Halogranum amylolyticum]